MGDYTQFSHGVGGGKGRFGIGPVNLANLKTAENTWCLPMMPASGDKRQETGSSAEVNKVCVRVQGGVTEPYPVARTLPSAEKAQQRPLEREPMA